MSGLLQLCLTATAEAGSIHQPMRRWNLYAIKSIGPGTSWLDLIKNRASPIRAPLASFFSPFPQHPKSSSRAERASTDGMDNDIN